MSDTPRTDGAANESIVRVYETSKQLEIELSNALHIQRLLESELAAAKDLAESNGKLAHDLGIKCRELQNQLNFLADHFPTKTQNKQP